MTLVLRTLAIPDTKRRSEGVRYNESWLWYGQRPHSEILTRTSLSN